MMKSSFLLIIVLIFTCAIGQAQEKELNTLDTASLKTIAVKGNDGHIVKESKLIDASELKTSISRSSSDIRIYLNLKRNVGNIDKVFPKINKAIKA